MGIQFHQEAYDNISQRVVATLAKGMIPFAPNGLEEPALASRRDLHDFLASLYATMFERPERFGMPTQPDDCLSSDSEGRERKQEVTKKVKRPLEITSLTIEFLQSLGNRGQVSDSGLVMDEEAFRSLISSKAKTVKAVLAGMSEVGLVTQAANGMVTISNARFPQMMPALKAMAEQSMANGDQRLGALCFARCDFNILSPDYQLDPQSFLDYFGPEDREKAIELHEYLLGTGHQAIYRAHACHGWDIQYQGPRKIKGSPLVQIDYSERHKNPMRVQIKCASADRLIPSFPEQPTAVQADFRSRVHRCGACGWCKSRKALHPSILEYGGEKLTVCWYTRSSVGNLNDETLELLRGYVRWHQTLIQEAPHH